MSEEFRDVFYESADGLTLHARDYPGPKDAPFAVLCLHGLTRNARDFEGLASHLAKRYRVIVPEQRGRGQSAHDPNPMNYHPVTYNGDMARLCDLLSVTRPAIIGTSMGGIMAMMMVAADASCTRGVVLNDIGPVVDAAGIARIQAHVGTQSPPATWAEAEAQARALNHFVFPDYGDGDWARFARILYREENGVPVLDYDPAISVMLQAGQAVPVSLWPVFESLKAVPTLMIRGAHSDILSADVFEAMAARLPEAEAVTVPNRGHAPNLMEPVAREAIDAFLARLS